MILAPILIVAATCVGITIMSFCAVVWAYRERDDALAQAEEWRNEFCALAASNSRDAHARSRRASHARQVQLERQAQLRAETTAALRRAA